MAAAGDDRGALRMAALRIVDGFSLLADSRGFTQQPGTSLVRSGRSIRVGMAGLRALPMLAVGTPGNAVAGWVQRVEALAGGDAGGLRVLAAEGRERRRTKWAEGGCVPGGGCEGG